jgi:hypothetical protein
MNRYTGTKQNSGRSLGNDCRRSLPTPFNDLKYHGLAGMNVVRQLKNKNSEKMKGRNNRGFLNPNAELLLPRNAKKQNRLSFQPPDYTEPDKKL